MLPEELHRAIATYMDAEDVFAFAGHSVLDLLVAPCSAWESLGYRQAHEHLLALGHGTISFDQLRRLIKGAFAGESARAALDDVYHFLMPLIFKLRAPLRDAAACEIFTITTRQTHFPRQSVFDSLQREIVKLGGYEQRQMIAMLYTKLCSIPEPKRPGFQYEFLIELAATLKGNLDDILACLLDSYWSISDRSPNFRRYLLDLSLTHPLDYPCIKTAPLVLEAFSTVGNTLSPYSFNGLLVWSERFLPADQAKAQQALCKAISRLPVDEQDPYWTELHKHVSGTRFTTPASTQQPSAYALQRKMVAAMLK